MQEYILNIQAAATAINMSAAAVQALAADTYAMVVELRQRLYSRKQMMWLNGVDNASPVPLISDQVSSQPGPLDKPIKRPGQ